VQPSSVERNSRRPIRQSISTARVPSSAVMKRQPNGFRPKIISPMPMTHLPSGGCAMKAFPSGLGMTSWCCSSSWLVLFGQVTSYP